MSDPKSPDPKSPVLRPGSSPDLTTRKRSLSHPDGLPSQDSDDLIRRKKDLVEAFDQLVEPLQQILKLMQRHQTFVVLVLIGVALALGGAVHTTLRLSKIEEALAAVIVAQGKLQQTSTTLEAKVDDAKKIAAEQGQVTIEPATTDGGDQTAVVVVKGTTNQNVKPIVIPLPIETSSPRPAMSASPKSAKPPRPKQSDDVILRIESR